MPTTSKILAWLVLIGLAVWVGLAFCVRADAAPSGELEPDKPCLTEDVMAGRLLNVVNTAGGFGGIIRRQAQFFADESHRMMRKPLTTVSVILFWYREAVAVAEINGKGCLGQMYPMPRGAFHEIIKSMPPANLPSN
jgi:hypothetical protein